MSAISANNSHKYLFLRAVMSRVFRDDILIFLIGFIAYPIIEILFRGYSHWTMAVTGGLVMLTLYHYHSHNPDVPLLLQCVVGAVIITLYELSVGCLVNIILDWHVWDYSAVPMNFLGQICLPFSIAWFFLSIAIFKICDLLQMILNRI